MTLEVPLRLAHATRRDRSQWSSGRTQRKALAHPPASLSAVERASERAHAPSLLRPSSSCAPARAGRSGRPPAGSSRVRPCQPATDDHIEARGDRGGRLPRMAQAGLDADFLEAAEAAPAWNRGRWRADVRYVPSGETARTTRRSAPSSFSSGTHFRYGTNSRRARPARNCFAGIGAGTCAAAGGLCNAVMPGHSATSRRSPRPG